MSRNILFVTTDQQRYDALGCNGGRVARTPVVDGLAAAGVNYRRAYNQNVVCMPARSTMITGLHPRTHGVIANGIPLPADAPSVAGWLHDSAGYRTALLGKAHFEPELDEDGRWFENRMATEGSTGPYRGFEHIELAYHGYWGRYHYDQWLDQHHPESISGLRRFTRASQSETGAPDIQRSSIPLEHYHTAWVADRTIDFLDSLAPDENWFVWMSFPDPHHPWNPPVSEWSRVPWRDLDPPEGWVPSKDELVSILERKPHHWLDIWQGTMRHVNAPPYPIADLSLEQVLEVNALIHVENELVDEACGRVLDRVAARGWADRTDVIFTTDHGELQGDFDLLYKGPFHVDALMRVPLVWRPAPCAAVTPAVVEEPVGHVNLAATFCEIADLPVPEWVQAPALPSAPGSPEHERVITEYDCQYEWQDIRLRSIYRDGLLCTVYEATDVYAGTEGELYDLEADPLQHDNLWDDAARAGVRADLVADLYDHRGPAREPPLAVEAPW